MTLRTLLLKDSFHFVRQFCLLRLRKLFLAEETIPNAKSKTRRSPLLIILSPFAEFRVGGYLMMEQDVNLR